MRAVSQPQIASELDHFVVKKSKGSNGTESGKGQIAAQNEAATMSALISSTKSTETTPTPDRVAEQARLRPTAPALVAGSATLTYGELDRRANQLARYLQSLGVGPEKLVGIYLERSPEMVVAALAVLKTGGAYVPLDPVLPAERFAYMLASADLCALVTKKSFEARLGSVNCSVVDLEKDAAAISASSAELLSVSVAAHNLAYVIYTSGSTGQPKGVELTHGGLQNLIAWHLRAFEVTAADRASHQACIGFDAAVWEVWPYLAAGASIYFPDESVRNRPEAFREWLLAHGITITFLATVLAERLLMLQWPQQTALRILLTGADTLHHRPSANLPFKLVNNYGPTEATVVATSGVVAPAEHGNSKPSIGKPIHNTQAYILDEERRPVAQGEVGELYIAGASLARGYRNRPDLTAERFVSNPFVSDPQARMYRTGDLASIRPDGQIDFLGRADEQIKIRGYRIEPGEIVAALNDCPGIETSAVVVEDSKTEKRLAAYIVLNAESNLTAGAVREFLRERLPDYMIPSVFVKVDTLPLTTHDKLDRAALPAPGEDNTLGDVAYVAPSGIVEERLAEIIARLLHVDHVGANENFFLLGGHSLLGTQLIAKVNESFGVELSLLNLFDHPTLAEMAAEIEKLVRAKIDAMSADEVLEALSHTGMERSR
jgi:amino acid adenylation domain-containing protein